MELNNLGIIMETEIKLSIVLILLSFVIGIYAHNLLPETVVTHWGINGEANGFSSKGFGTFFTPILMVALLLLFLVIPKIDPLHKNIDEFKQEYHRFIFVLTAFMFLVYIQMIMWNLGVKINFNATLPILLSGLFIYLSFLFEKTKMNWFVGIRTPWTLSSEEVWNKTHKFGARAFRVAGVLILTAIFVPQYTFFIVIGLVLLVVFATIIYSYLEYNKLSKNK